MHNSLLHRERGGNGNKSDNDAGKDGQNSPSVAASSPAVSSSTPQAMVQSVTAPLPSTPNVLLATAWESLRTVEDRTFKMRALLDQGSTVSFISESLCQLMRTKRYRADLQVLLAKNITVARSRVPLTLKPCDDRGTAFPFTGFVYQKITLYAVSRARPVESWPHLRNLKLADPDPSSNHPIHVLIGADLYGSLLINDLRQGPIGTPTAQKTVLGLDFPALPGRLTNLPLPRRSFIAFQLHALMS